MKRRRILLLSAGLVVAVILAFFLQDVIHRTVITPAAYLWWVLKIVYATLPQLFLWILLLVGLIFILATSLLNWYSIGRTYEEPSKPIRGAVETLAGWISRSREGNYYKWMIANRLGKLAQEMSGHLDQRKNQALPEEREDPGRLPPEAVRRYLKSGLEESFVDYPPQKSLFRRRQTTPFDLDADEVIAFLESQMEARSGQKHS